MVREGVNTRIFLACGNGSELVQWIIYCFKLSKYFQFLELNLIKYISIATTRPGTPSDVCYRTMLPCYMLYLLLLRNVVKLREGRLSQLHHQDSGGLPVPDETEDGRDRPASHPAHLHLRPEEFLPGRRHPHRHYRLAEETHHHIWRWGKGRIAKLFSCIS